MPNNDWPSASTRKEDTIHVFALGGTLKSLEPELKNLMAFGTDDEKAFVGVLTKPSKSCSSALRNPPLQKHRHKACVYGHYRRE